MASTHYIAIQTCDQKISSNSDPYQTKTALFLHTTHFSDVVAIFLLNVISHYDKQPTSCARTFSSQPVRCYCTSFSTLGAAENKLYSPKFSWAIKFVFSWN